MGTFVDNSGTDGGQMDKATILGLLLAAFFRCIHYQGMYRREHRNTYMNWNKNENEQTKNMRSLGEAEENNTLSQRWLPQRVRGWR